MRLTLYHGSPIRIEKFVWRSCINEIEQEGPGIYLTTSMKDASTYASSNGFIYEVEWKYKKLISTKKISENVLTQYIFGFSRLIKKNPEWRDACQNWDEEPEEGLQIALRQIIETSDSLLDAYQTIWGDFYRNQPIEFCKNMSNWYDGFIKQRREEVKHAIVFNPETLIIKKEIPKVMKESKADRIKKELELLEKEVLKENELKTFSKEIVKKLCELCFNEGKVSPLNRIESDKYFEKYFNVIINRF